MIDPLTVVSLRLQSFSGDRPLSGGTGFIVDHNGDLFLISAGHVFTGIHPDTGEIPAGIPDRLLVFHNVKKNLGIRFTQFLPLKNEKGMGLWKEHPDGREIDVAALPLSVNGPVRPGNSETEIEIAIHPLDLGLAHSDMSVSPGTDVCVIGYPLPFEGPADMWPIWKTGNVASEPDIDRHDKPLFLIDATTRSGMSGSPVLARRSGGYHKKTGEFVIAGGIVTKFLGVYTGRLGQVANERNEAPELGMVWKPRVIDEILSS